MGRNIEYDRLYRVRNIDSIRRRNCEYAQRKRGLNTIFPLGCIPELGFLVSSKFFEKANQLVINLHTGSHHSKGYRKITFNYKHIFVHRFIWEFVNGKIPKGMTIDHINHDKSDNRIENLRLVSNGENHKNMPLNKRNKSGVSGVYFNKKSNRWNAQININKKTKGLGSFLIVDDAIKARRHAEKVNNYHVNHGRVI